MSGQGVEVVWVSVGFFFRFFANAFSINIFLFFFW